MFGKPTMEKRIEQFWTWFQAHCQLIGDPPAEPVAGLTRQLSKVHKGLVWGCSLPDEHGIATLEISPDGQRELVDIVRKIVTLAPSIVGWRIVAFRQRSDGFKIKMLGREIGPDDGKAMLFQDQDGTKFLQAFLPDEISQKTMNGLAPIMLDHALGEEFVLQFELLHPRPLSQAPAEASTLNEMATFVVPEL